MKAVNPAPSAAAKCTCGHRYDQHVRGGGQHACQYGAEPPYKNVCSCRRFRPAGAPRATLEVATNSKPSSAGATTDNS